MVSVGAVRTRSQQSRGCGTHHYDHVLARASTVGHSKRTGRERPSRSGTVGRRVLVYISSDIKARKVKSVPEVEPGDEFEKSHLKLIEGKSRSFAAQRCRPH